MRKSLLQRWFGRADGNEALALARTHKSEGDALLGRGDPAAAETCYRAAIAAAPNFAPAHTNLAYALDAQARPAQAARTLRQALALDAAQSDAHYLAARMARTEDRADDAERHYRRALDLAPDMDVACLELCTLLVEQQRLAEAVAVVSTALTRQPDHLQLLVFLGNLQQQLGQYPDAIASYRAALAREQNAPGVLNNLGLALLKRNDAAGINEAVGVFEEFVRLTPESAEAHNHLGHARARAGDIAQAIPSFERALALAPDLAQASFNLGNALFTQGHAEAAIAQYEQALAANPGLADAHYHLGYALQGMQRLTEAQEHYRATLDLVPDHTEALMQQGYLLQLEKQFDDALACYRKILAQHPDNIDALFNSGLALRGLADAYEMPYREEKIEEAMAAYRAALAIDPKHIRSLNNLAGILKEREEFDQAMACFQTIVALEPELGPGYHNLAVLLDSWSRHGPIEERTPRMEQAVPYYLNALAINPEDMESLIGLATIKSELGQTDETLALYSRVFAIDPEMARARLNHGLLLLSLGRFAEGWRDYEYRWAYNPDLTRRESAQPHWHRGIDPAGKTLLLYAEQGLGDSLQFVRYASLLARLGATVWISVPSPLMLLLASCPGVARVFSSDDTIPPYDYLCPILSVPGILGTELDTIPAEIPYLKAAPERIAHWRDKLGARRGLRVGLVWAGNPRKGMTEESLVDRVRSLHFDRLRPLLDVPGIDFYSLQVGQDAAEQLAGAPQVIDHSDALFDFQETAALAENLDLAICVDTSTAHLVGAIGKPVWLLNRHNSCWRWLTERSDSPWYPGMRIFRQPKLGDWDSVVAEVKIALQDEAGKTGHTAQQV